MIDLIATDTMFPELRSGMDTDAYLRENNNYLFLLRENLNYALHNLGIANFNSRQLDVLSGKITEPVYNELRDAEGNIASLYYDYGLIEGRVSENENNISDIRIDTAGIHSAVSQIQGDVSSLNSDVSAITVRVSNVEQTASGISTSVAEIQGNYISATSAKQTSNSFDLQVLDGNTVRAQLNRTGLNIYGGALSLYSAGTSASNRVLYADNSGNLYVKGQITATSLSLGNGVTIDAAKLSGIMNPTVVSAMSFSGNQIQANTITALQIAANTITSNEIAANGVTAYNIDATNLHVNAANIDGTLSANHIKLGGNMEVYQNLTDTSSIGGYVGYTTSNVDTTSHGIAITSPTAGRGQVVATNNGARLSYGSAANPYSQVYASINNGDGFAALGAVSTGNTVRFTGSTAEMFFAPTCYCYVGTPSGTGDSRGLRWFAGAYLGSSVMVTSDRNRKHDISYDLSKYDPVFDLLKPASYLYDDGMSGRTHTGFIAQDVEDAVFDAGLTLKDFAAVAFSLDQDGNRIYFMRNDELISLCVRQIQLLKARVAALEGATI